MINTNATPSPWLSRREAADYLRMSTRTIDRHLVRMGKECPEGKMRCETRKTQGERTIVRVFAKDVYAILPVPEVA